MPEGLILAVAGTVGILIVVCFYPLALLLRPGCPPLFCAPDDDEGFPSVTMITAARNAGALLRDKIENFKSLDYPPDRLILLVASDASTDSTRQIVQDAADPRVRLVEQGERLGKAAAMNLAVRQAESDLLLFSDADALLASGSVRVAVGYFSDSQIGGVCGMRAAVRNTTGLRDAQQTYIRFDSRLRLVESARGSITSNDGKFHMIRRSAYQPIPRGVSDDLFTLLSVVLQGYRFVFEPDAVAEVMVPSRDARHEVSRRRRIVILSLTALLRVKPVLNPFRFGWFSVGLWMNKVGRRFLPFFFLTVLLGLLWIMTGGCTGIVAVALTALLLVPVAAVLISPLRQRKTIRLIFYVLAGLFGTAWGTIEFVAGRRIISWEPRKTCGDML